MKENIISIGRLYKYISREEVEYSPVEDQSAAMDSMKKLEKRLTDLNFKCTKNRETKWDPKEYLSIMGSDGRFVLIKTYFSGSKDTIREKQSVNYDIAGLEEDIDLVMKRIEMEGGVIHYTCR